MTHGPYDATHSCFAKKRDNMAPPKSMKKDASNKRAQGLAGASKSIARYIRHANKPQIWHHEPFSNSMTALQYPPTP